VDDTAQASLLSLKQMAELFDVQGRNGRPATETICQWWHSGRIPPPDIKISRKAIYWKKSTIDEFISRGGLR
jgi:hypothetical protein